LRPEIREKSGGRGLPVRKAAINDAVIVAGF
jgi:hypothetical protein